MTESTIEALLRFRCCLTLVMEASRQLHRRSCWPGGSSADDSNEAPLLVPWKDPLFDVRLRDFLSLAMSTEVDHWQDPWIHPSVQIWVMQNWQDLPR